MSTHEENIKKEFFENEGIEEDNTKLKRDDENLQLVNANISPDDEEIKKLKENEGRYLINLENLPSGGIFYRNDIKISIKAATVKEIVNFSTVDEEAFLDANDKLDYILLSCAKVTYGDKPGSYKDLLQEDKIFIILSIKELTFAKGENSLMLNVDKSDCEIPNCGVSDKIELKSHLLEFDKIDPDLLSKYDEQNRSIKVSFKNDKDEIQTYHMAPPTVGVSKAIYSFMIWADENKFKYEKGFLNIVPFIYRNWRQLNEKNIKDILTKMNSYDTRTYTILHRVIEKMQMAMKPNISIPCQKCGREVTAPVDFQGGIKSLFILSDIGDQLL